MKKVIKDAVTSGMKSVIQDVVTNGLKFTTSRVAHLFESNINIGVRYYSFIDAHILNTLIKPYLSVSQKLFNTTVIDDIDPNWLRVFRAQDTIKQNVGDKTYTFIVDISVGVTLCMITGIYREFNITNNIKETRNSFRLIGYNFKFVGPLASKLAKDIKRQLVVIRRASQRDLHMNSLTNKVEYSGSGKLIVCESFDNTYSKNNDVLITRISHLLNHTESYDALGVPPKLSIMLYGEPGTGKSKTISSILHFIHGITDKPNELNIKIDVYNITRLKGVDFIMTPEDQFDNYSELINNGVSIAAPKESKKCIKIIIIEEIDMICPSREDYKDISHDNNSNNSNTLKEYMDLFDGKWIAGSEADAVIIISTTNYIDRLDHALIRDGRVDLSLEYKGLNREEAKDFIIRIGHNDEIVAEEYVSELFQDPSITTIVPATIENYMIRRHIEKSMKKLIKQEEIL